jgi:copper chaperone
MATETFTVTGMTCAHCVNAVREEIARIEGVMSVAVDLASATTTVVSLDPLDRADIVAAVAEAGYEVAP